jgi:hypothetical protein
VGALKSDLVGPYTDDPTQDEVLEYPPSRWYLTGFLAPQLGRETNDPTAEDELKGPESDDDDDAASATVEPEPKQKRHYPASLGMSVLLPPPPDTTEPDHITVTLRYANYVKVEPEPDVKPKPKTLWRRQPVPEMTVELPLTAAMIEHGVYVDALKQVQLCGKLEPITSAGLPTNTRALSLFVVNHRERVEKGPPDESYLFQVELELYFERGFVGRPNRQGEKSDAMDDRTSDLQLREHLDWAVGHNASVQAPEVERLLVDGHVVQKVTRLQTTWFPTYEITQVRTHEEPAVITEMQGLASLCTSEPTALRAALEPLVTGYARWITEQGKSDSLGKKRDEVRRKLLKNASIAQARMQEGIELLLSNANARRAFEWMNIAMHRAALARSPKHYNDASQPKWRLFQLAFVLVSLASVTDETHPDRDCVELIFFPTGGGKTEAYLGVIAYCLLLRRITGKDRVDKGLGVSVLLRYTLRLLTLDQLSRAATLVCALELLRRQHSETLGSTRFAVGLWVGRAATANTLEQVRRQCIDYKNANSESSPFPLPTCPWCGGTLGKSSITVEPTGVKVVCAQPNDVAPSVCEFSARKSPEGIPVLFVDEQIYHELPCFIVATVDKFAMLPWRGEAGMLFGRVDSHDAEKNEFFGPTSGTAPRSASKIPGGLRPPDLIVQDELHLISGPLGTMVGLYECAIDFLCSREVGLASGNTTTVRPKVLASTATVRRAKEQVQALFGRSETRLFPPPGPEASETFFATRDTDSPGRLYVGVAAPGRPLKAILLRTYIALLAAANKQFAAATPEHEASTDSYMTLVGYFNSLRELGGMRRLVEDDVRTRTDAIERRVPIGMPARLVWAKSRSISFPVELTSREKQATIKKTKNDLTKPHKRAELTLTSADGAAKKSSKASADGAAIDVLLASNMISVGVDIDRLGLMVVGGQPKGTSEYIQATSRVGRKFPGLVVTCLNVARPRDRSHFERFVAYHQSIYRFVEVTSVTPFSGPALDRGLSGTLLSMARLGEPKLTASTSAMDIELYQAFVRHCINALADRAQHHRQLDTVESEKLRAVLEGRGGKLLEAWIKLVQQAIGGATKRQYSELDRDKTAGKPLLHGFLDELTQEYSEDEKRFALGTSMRDVEPSVHLWLKRANLGGRS